MKKPSAAVIIGASGGIGAAVLKRFEDDSSVDIVIAISRNIGSNSDKTFWMKSDYSETSINSVTNNLAERNLSIRYVVIATGILHKQEAGIMPEKRIASLQAAALEKVFAANAFTPILWLKSLSQLLNKSQQTNIAVLSARVGSISDNQLGGWYSYRASKAALNMLLKSLAIEFSLRFPKVKLTAFHPGTTNTELSKPFQNNIPKEKLFEAEFVADQLHKLLAASAPDGRLSFQDWQHKEIQW
jgi:NAD(P)-dependent dehydrogenase (short-subunit alcohol dehydrogenase family)